MLTLSKNARLSALIAAAVLTSFSASAFPNMGVALTKAAFYQKYPRFKDTLPQATQTREGNVLTLRVTGIRSFEITQVGSYYDSRTIECTTDLLSYPYGESVTVGKTVVTIFSDSFTTSAYNWKSIELKDGVLTVSRVVNDRDKIAAEVYTKITFPAESSAAPNTYYDYALGH